MACNGAYASVQQFADFYCIGDTCIEERATIQNYLDIAVSDIHAALASVGACDCSLATWATGYLQKLNIIDAAAYFNCPCANPRLNNVQKEMLLNWMSTQLQNIVTGDIDLCAGATGSKFPAMGWASQSVSAFAAAQIIYDDIIANSG